MPICRSVCDSRLGSSEAHPIRWPAPVAAPFPSRILSKVGQAWKRSSGVIFRKYSKPLAVTNAERRIFWASPGAHYIVAWKTTNKKAPELPMGVGKGGQARHATH